MAALCLVLMCGEGVFFSVLSSVLIFISIPNHSPHLIVSHRSGFHLTLNGPQLELFVCLQWCFLCVCFLLSFSNLLRKTPQPAATVQFRVKSSASLPSDLNKRFTSVKSVHFREDQMCVTLKSTFALYCVLRLFDFDFLLMLDISTFALLYVIME